MRILGASLLGLLAAVLVACNPSAAPSPTPTMTPVASGSAATETPPPAPAPSATTAPAATATAAATVTSPTVEVTAQGPLTAAGQLVTKVVPAPGAQVRYGPLSPGLARSDDAGATWQKVSDLLLPPLLVAPGDPEVVYAGDTPSCYKDEEAPAFRRSTDGGQSWQELAAGQGIRPVAALAGDGHGTLYGISCPGLSVSRDGGETWELTGGTMGFDITSILPITEGDSLRLLAVLTSEGGSSHLAWFSQDGKLAQDMTDGLNFWGKGALAQAGSNLYVADSTGVWRGDVVWGGWQRFKAGLEDVILDKDPLTEGLSEEDMARGFGLLSLAADPLNPQRLALGTVRGLYISQDGGEQWSPVALPDLAGARVEQVTWEPSAPGRLYASTPDGVRVLQLAS